ncbi:flagellar biosynthesis repressor FlbT [Sphingomonas sp. CFBP9019]|jgi:flagellar protein FlbT|uniref:flagellar biosynthesis repressor FlbT n=1 Tax=Sphingomonas sp. CFBP9019 TaxID=3096532 RepID=UPI002A6A10DD|nr:flagellar biosynthesis repressor FlbT [Sphingomonas sp. CFBP9019]MDY1009898.1 flagellar biosynthesis repressor FlbT [Sphingomonas sp. CFBP9019]
MTLRITVRDGERLVVNGAVMRAAKRCELIIENPVSILREREIMTPNAATTPARRLYLACMMAYIDERHRPAHHDDVVARLAELFDAFEAEAAQQACASFARLVATGDYYRALATCRTLITYEAEALGRLQAAAA